jgi:outer membrane protein, heavy metal efflux system
MKAVYIAVLVIAGSFAARAQDAFSVTANLLSSQRTDAQPGTPAMNMEQLEQIASQSNPEIRVAAHRIAQAEAHVPSAGALEDPSFMYRGWQVPFRQPWNYNAAQNMFMLGRALPGPGKRALRTTIAGDEVEIAKADLEAKRREIQAKVRKAFYDLLRNDDELRVHDQQVAIARQGLEAARIKYTVGRVPQQDVLKAQVALTRLVEHLVMLEQDGELTRAALNTLLGRDPAEPVGVTGEEAMPSQLPPIADLERIAEQSRPELARAAAEIKQASDEVRLAAKGNTPDFSVNAGYMLMPRGSEFRNNYMVEGSVSLPWLNRRKHDAEITEAKSKVSVRESELEAVRSVVFQQIQEALVRANSAKRLVDFYRAALRPQTEAMLHSTVIAYENDKTDFLNLLDSQNATLDVDFSYFHAVADFEAAMADLELAVGSPIARTGQQPATEVVR